MQKCRMTTKGVVSMVLCTYTACLDLSFMLSCGAEVWPSSLVESDRDVFVFSALVHAVLSAGFIANLALHNYLTQSEPKTGCIAIRTLAGDDNFVQDMQVPG